MPVECPYGNIDMIHGSTCSTPTQLEPPTAIAATTQSSAPPTAAASLNLAVVAAEQVPSGEQVQSVYRRYLSPHSFMGVVQVSSSVMALDVHPLSHASHVGSPPLNTDSDEPILGTCPERHNGRINSTAQTERLADFQAAPFWLNVGLTLRLVWLRATVWMILIRLSLRLWLLILVPHIFDSAFILLQILGYIGQSAIRPTLSQRYDLSPQLRHTCVNICVAAVFVVSAIDADNGSGLFDDDRST